MSELHFRWRNHEPSRIESFSDAVFGFAITLVVVSLEVPHTYGALVDSLRAFPGFAVCFAVIATIWYQHHLFFRRYALQDAITAKLNIVLLFVVLFYIYPLKFLMTHKELSPHEMRGLMAIYGAGLCAVHALFGALYVHAYRKRQELELDALELVQTRTSCMVNFSIAGTACLAVLIAVAIPDPWGGPISGASYLSILVSTRVLKRRRDRAIARLTAGAATGALESRPSAAGAG